MSEAKPPNGSGHGLDMKGLLGPALREPCAKHFSEFGLLIAELFKGREEVATSFQKFLFGSESYTERKMNDTGASVRGAMTTMGIDPSSWLGAAPERPPPHSKIIIRRGGPGAPVSTGLVELNDPPEGGAKPQDVPDLDSYQEGWLSAYHILVEGEPPTAGMLSSFTGGETTPSWSDLRFTAAVGSHATMVKETIELAEAWQSVIAWTVSDVGDPAVVRQTILDSFPKTAASCGLNMDIDKWQVEKKKMESGNVELSIDVPVLPSKAGAKYPRLSELMQLFDPMLIHFKHPKTGASLMVWTVQDKKLHIHLYMKDGKLAWEGGDGTEGPAYWDKDGQFVCDIIIDCSMVLLDLNSVASIPFPRMKMRCEMDVKGEVKVKCIEAGEPSVPQGVAEALTFDIGLFRRKLVEGFEFGLCHMDLGENRSAVRMYHRFLFPSNSVATLVSQWFQEFVMRQMRELDAMEAVSIFCQALAEDAQALSQGLPPRT